MSEQDNENLDSINQAADEQSSDTDTNDTAQDDSANDSIDAEKLKELNKKLYERAKKAESEAKELRKKSETPKPSVQEQKDMSSKDLYALMEHKVPSKHIDEVVKASKILGKSIPETLADGFVQARLKTLAEEEQTANATSTGGSKRTATKLSDEQIVQRYMEGKDVDPEAFALARINLRKKR